MPGARTRCRSTSAFPSSRRVAGSTASRSIRWMRMRSSWCSPITRCRACSIPRMVACSGRPSGAIWKSFPMAAGPALPVTGPRSCIVGMCRCTCWAPPRGSGPRACWTVPPPNGSWKVPTRSARSGSRRWMCVSPMARWPWAPMATECSAE
ncbi:MAG: ash family protein [Candidatus Cloacimonetes bacterium]|nr:ash family protein [Candidatus Cloacimonadota bacterium]